jgi:hypothetical protein
MGVLFFYFGGDSIQFSIVVVLIYIPQTVYEGFFFPTSSPIFFVIHVLDGSHPNRSKVDSQNGFDLHFLHGQGY